MNENPHLQRAQLLLDQHRIDLAEAELRQVLAAEPEHPQALALLGLCRLEQNDLPTALHFAEQAIATEPDWAFPYYLRALTLVRRNRVDDATREMSRVIELDPTDPDYRCFLAGIQVACNRAEQGIETARLGLQFDPRHVGCLNLIARERIRTGHLAEAASLLRTSLEIDPQRSETLSLQGELHMREGDIEAARRAFDLALTRSPGQPEAQQGLMEARRAGNAVYRRLLPLLLRGEKMTAQEPFTVRLILLTLIVVLCAAAAKLPVGKWIGLAIAGSISFVLAILILAKPLMNLKFSADQLQWYALPWQERFLSQGMILSAAWCLLWTWIGLRTGINNPLFLLAITSAIPIIPINAIGCHHSPEMKRALWPYAIGSLVLWIIPAVAYALNWIERTEIIGIFGALSLLVAGPKTSSLMEQELETDSPG